MLHLKNASLKLAFSSSKHIFKSYKRSTDLKTKHLIKRGSVLNNINLIGKLGAFFICRH